MRVFVASLALTVMIVAHATAQEQSKPKFYVAGGVDLKRLLNDTYRTGLGASFQIGYFRQISRFGVRLGGAYYERGGYSGPSVFFRERHSQWRTVAATVDLTYDLTATRVRPYIIGGGSLSRSSGSIQYTDGESTRYAWTGVAPALGVGLRFPLGTAEGFTELRMHFGRNAHRTGVLLPFVFGIRF